MHAHHTIWFISLSCQHDYDVKPLDARNYGGRTRSTILFLFLNFDMVVVIQFQENSATFAKLIEKWLEKLTLNNFLSNVFTFVAVLYRSEVSRQSLASRSSIFETRFSILETFEDRVSRLENRVSRFASRKIRNLS